MRPRFYLLALPALGCAESTYWPEPGMPAYGEAGADSEWQQCSNLGSGASGTSTLTITNTLADPVDLNWVDPSCIEQPYTELASGESFVEDIEHGYVFVVREQESGFIYAHFLWTGEEAEWVIP